MPDSTMLQSKDLQERYERYKAKIKNFTIMNDIFMRNVLKKKECIEEKGMYRIHLTGYYGR